MRCCWAGIAAVRAACWPVRRYGRRIAHELSAAIPGTELRFVLLEVPREVLEQRMVERKGHYMSPALLESQIATLEMPRDAIRVAGDLPPDAVVQEIMAGLRGAESHP